MSNFKIGDNVQTLHNGQGVVIKLFEDVKTAIVDCKNGDIAKVPFNEMVKEAIEKSSEEPEITITFNQFQEIVLTNIKKMAGTDLGTAAMLGIFANKLQESFFDIRSENE